MANYNADIRIAVTGKAQLNQLEAQLKRTQTTLNKLNKSLNLRARVQRVRLDTRQATSAVRALEQRINKLGRTITVNLRVNEKEGTKKSNNSSAAIVNNQSAPAQNAALVAALATTKQLTQADRERKQINQQLAPLLDKQSAKQKEIAAQVEKIRKNRTEAANVEKGFGTKARLNQLNFGYEQLIRKLKRLRGEYNNVGESVRNYQRAASQVNDREIIRAEQRRQRVNDLRRKKQNAQNLRRAAGAGAGVGLLGGPLGNIAGGALAGGAVGGPKGALIGAAIAGVTELSGAMTNLGNASANTFAQLQLQRRALANTVSTAEEYEQALRAIRGVTDDFLVPLDQSTENFTKLNAAARSSGFTVKEVEEVYRGLAAANTALGGDSERLQGILLATQQVFSKGKVQAEELRGQIGERLAGAFAKFAESADLSTSQLDKALENGEVSLKDFVRFAKKMLEDYEEDAKKIADAPENAGKRLEQAMTDLKTALGPLTASIGTSFQEMATEIVKSINQAMWHVNRFQRYALEKQLNNAIQTRDDEVDRRKWIDEGGFMQGNFMSEEFKKGARKRADESVEYWTRRATRLQKELNNLNGPSITASGKEPGNRPEDPKDEPDKTTKSDLNRIKRDKERLQRAMQGVQNAKDLLALETQIEQARRRQDERQVTVLEGEKGILQIRQRLAGELIGVTDERLKQAKIDEAAIEALRLQEQTLTRLTELDRERSALIKGQVEEQKELLQGLKDRQDELERIKNKRNDPTDLTSRVRELMKDGVSFSRAWEIETAIDEANKLNDTMDAAAQRQKQLWEGVGQTIKSALVDTIQQAIQGTADMSEILSGLLTQLGGMFLNAGVSGLGQVFNLPGFANGGILPSSGPALVGENGPELALSSAGQTTIVPLDQAMNRYQPTNSGASAAAGGSAGGGGPDGGTVVNYNGPTLRFNSEDYVPMSAVNGIIDAAAAKGAKAGQARTMGALRNSRSQRAKVGL